MKVKLLLKFYFNAASLNEWLDRLIEYRACRIEGGDFEKISELIEHKQKLCRLMNYLEGKFEKLTKRDIETLKWYSSLRVGIRNLEDGLRREIKRAVMKFARRLTYIERHEEEVKTLKNYRAIFTGS